MAPIARIQVVIAPAGGAWRSVLVSGPLSSRREMSSGPGTQQTKGDLDIRQVFPPLVDGKFPGISQQALKRGTGGRSSFNGIVATVFGANGHTGRAVCNQLGKVGTQVIIPYRNEAYYSQKLKLVGDLGQVHFLPFHLKDEASIRKAMKYSNVVINLIGKENETSNFSFDEVHVEGARRLARIAREMGIQRFIHAGALGSSPKPTPYILKNGCGFLRSKYWGEVAVREEFPEATILRPADIFGHEDRFGTYFVHVYRRQFHKVPLYNYGLDIWKQPIFVNDVAKGIAAAVTDDEAPGNTYDCLGPKRYQLQDIVRYMSQVVQKDEEYGYYIKDLKWAPTLLARIWLIEKLRPKYPPVCFDKLEKECHSDYPVDGNLRLEDLIKTELTPMEHRMRFDLECWRRLAFYDDALGEFPPPPHPPSVRAL